MNLSECLVDGAHERDRSAVFGSRVALGVVREDRGGSVELFEELSQGWGFRLEVVEPRRRGGSVDLPGVIESEEDASAVAAEHDAGAVVGEADWSVFGEVVEHQVGRVDEVSVVDVGQSQLGDRGVEGDQRSGDGDVFQPCGRSSALLVGGENVVVAW